MKLNSDYKQRDEIIFGSYDKDKYFGGCRRANVSADIVRFLFNNKFIDPNENQNDSPTTQEFLDMIEGCEDYVDFEIYCISPERDDYRITIEGIDAEIDENKPNIVAYFVNCFRYADEFSFNYSNGVYYLHAWWD